MMGAKRVNAAFPLLGIVLSLSAISHSDAAVYAGNGATGFGGPVGTGQLSVTDDAAGSVTFTFNSPVGSTNGNDLVVYLYTGATGISDTSTLTDNGDGGREAVSGYNAANTNITGTAMPTRTLVTFPTGLQATYALSIEDNYESLFQLPQPNTVNYLTYITGAAQTGATPYSLTIPLADIGLTQGQSFGFDGTLIATSTYRSNETIGPTSPDVSTGGNVGYTDGINFSQADVYTTTAVPEPTGAAAIAACAAVSMKRRRSLKKR